jgi:hypothetical protein
MTLKSLISLLVIILTFIGYVPYIRDIFKKKTQPHIFTWFTVSLTAFVAYALQVRGGAGVGALPMLVVSSICVFVFIVSFKYGTKNITKLDIFFLILSILALFLWLVVNQPILSVVLITVSEIFGYIPTIRKSWNRPYSETLSLYQISFFRHTLAIFALQKLNILTVLYPAAWAVTNLFITVVLISRRNQIKN